MKKLVIIVTLLIVVPYISADKVTIGSPAGDKFSQGGSPIQTVFTGGEVKQKEQPSSGGGSGGGGSGAAPVKPKNDSGINDIIVSPKSFNMDTTINVDKSSEISLENTGNGTVDIEISKNKPIKDIINLEKNKVSIKPDEKVKVPFKIGAPSEAGIYSGKIQIIAEDGRKEVPFTLNVDSKKSLFDISIDITEENKVIEKGENLPAQIYLLQAGNRNKTEVKINYKIKDLNGSTISINSENMTIEDEKEFSHEYITKNLERGQYIIGSEVLYEGKKATASTGFRVKEKGISTIMLVLTLILGIILLIILIMLANRYSKRQNEKQK